MKNLTPTTSMLLAGLALLGSSISALSQTLMAINPNQATTDSTVAVGSNDVIGYFFAATVPTAGGSQADISSYADAPFISSVTPSLSNRYNGGSAYATISANGTSYYTGVNYTGNGSSSYQNVAKIQLTSSVTTLIPKFQIGILTGSASSDFENDNLYQLSLFTSSGTQIGTTLKVNDSPDDAKPTSPDFFFATVSGATAGDYLEISAAQNPTQAGNIVFAGLTISSITVPEPSTYALMLGGLVALGAIALRRRVS